MGGTLERTDLKTAEALGPTIPWLLLPRRSDHRKTAITPVPTVPRKRQVASERVLRVWRSGDAEFFAGIAQVFVEEGVAE
jgi:hypothetical protein